MMNTRPAGLRAALLLVALALLLTSAYGCKPKPTTSANDAGNGSSTETTTSSSETTPLPTTDGSSAEATSPLQPQSVRVYFTRGDKLGVSTRQIPPTRAVATAAMRELLAGPSDDEAAFGLGTTIPDGTRLLGVSVKDGVATVDLSHEFESGGGSLSMTMRLTQVVHTLTQFSTIKSVRFSLDGKPVHVFSGEGLLLDEPQTRLSYEDVLPAILVESPTPGQSARSTVRVYGTANVFEAVFIAEVRDAAGATLTKKIVTASAGTGTRGTFDVTIPFATPKTQMGSIVVYAESAKDGSRIDIVTIPLKLER